MQRRRRQPRQLGSRASSTSRQRRERTVSHVHPPETRSAELLALFFAVHEIAKTSYIRWARVIPARKRGIRLWFLEKAYAPLVFHSEVFIVKFVVSGKVLMNILNSVWVGIGEPFHRNSIVEKVHDKVMSSKVGCQCFVHTDARDCNGSCGWAQEVPWTIEPLMFLDSLDIRGRYGCQVCKLTSNNGSRPSS